MFGEGQRDEKVADETTSDVGERWDSDVNPAGQQASHANAMPTPIAIAIIADTNSRT